MEAVVVDHIAPAMQHLQHDPMAHLLKCFAKNHQGHTEICKAIIYAVVLQSSATSKGLQVFITGTKGSGKSSAIKSVTHLLPRTHLFTGSFSPKALYYSPPLEKGVIFVDDITLDEETLSLVKRVMTNFQEETPHRTVIQGQGKVLKLPRRLIFLGSSVWEAGDDQLKDRCLNVGVQNEAADNEAYYAFEQARREKGQEEYVTDHDILEGREMIAHIKAREFRVEMCKIRFANTNDRRLMNQFYDLVEASAILNYLQREHREEDGIIVVKATKDDVQAAGEFTMFKISNPKAEGRFTKAEAAFDQILQDKIGEAAFVVLSESEIVRVLNKSLCAVRTTLYGRGGSARNISGGMLEKSQWYSIVPGDRGNHDIMIRKAPPMGAGEAFAWVDETTPPQNSAEGS